MRKSAVARVIDKLCDSLLWARIPHWRAFSQGLLSVEERSLQDRALEIPLIKKWGWQAFAHGLLIGKKTQYSSLSVPTAVLQDR
ncbi:MULTISPECIES: hypothetical protein [Rhizobium]|uniref:Uncharacterized protein n=1 Tax=Rhizobium tropici TaxID=398 RepID=A0A6P1C3I4_RHITR|nr:MULTISPECIES: hypothetical protein [Rhizobium]MBB4242449.1 hypothetical protein [Rhizobium tropici]MBB5594092.1 hypothetical protein [Rhizobium tropici]MBB6492787.1 hypothetical protein [Rhizobium tropici]NEV11760.1 hypothetical protein [Rhizobium tropici]